MKNRGEAGEEDEQRVSTHSKLHTN